MESVEKTYYGSLCALRGYCDDCEQMALIINGRLQCCDKEVEKPKRFTTKRMCATAGWRRSPLPYSVRQEILEDQHYRCYWCSALLGGYRWNYEIEDYEEIKVHFDHVMPWSYNQNEHWENFVASCDLCNAVKSDKVFDTLEEVQAYILKKRGIE